MIIGPFTVTRGTITPYTIDVLTPQKTRKAGDGSVTVAAKGYLREVFLRAKVKVGKDEADQIESFLTYGMDFATGTFNLTDGYGDVYVVRFWDKRVRKRASAANLVELDLLFRQEVVAP